MLFNNPRLLTYIYGTVRSSARSVSIHLVTSLVPPSYFLLLSGILFLEAFRTLSSSYSPNVQFVIFYILLLRRLDSDSSAYYRIQGHLKISPSQIPFRINRIFSFTQEILHSPHLMHLCTYEQKQKSEYHVKYEHCS